MFLGCPAALSQHITGSIVGVVTDSTQGAIPGAQISVKSAETGSRLQVVTDSSGTYTVPDLPPGRYEVTAVKSGFQTKTVSNIDLMASTAVRINVVLNVGGTQQTLTVQGEAPLVHTESGTVDDDVSARQMMDLPFTTQGIDQVMSLAPGVQSAGNNPRISGNTYWGSANFTLNGVSVNSALNGGSSYTYSLGLINLGFLDTMQELKVASSSMSAEYRGAASVTLVTKQGTNGFHGGASEYLQNRDLSADTFLLNLQGSPRPKFNRNQFTAYLGGPIRSNKLFFFVHYGVLRQRSAQTVQLTLPSAAMRQGDFSALCPVYNANGVCTSSQGTQLYNPFTGQAFANNRIPGSMITPQAQRLLSFLPALTRPGALGLPFEAPNYVGTSPQIVDINNVNARIDYNLSAADRVYGVFTRSISDPWRQPLGSTPATYGNGGNYGVRTNSIAASETHLFNPTTVNEFRASWFVWAPIRRGQNTDFTTADLFPQLTQISAVEDGGLPATTMTGYAGMFTDPVGRNAYTPVYNIQYTDSITHVTRGHTLKAGADVNGAKIYQRRQGEPGLPTFSFNGQWTGNKGWPGMPQSQGNAFADFLIGTANTSSAATQATDIITYSRDLEFYIQDTWQASPGLTLIFGVRYMYQSPWVTRDNIASFFDFSRNKLAVPASAANLIVPPFANPGLLSLLPSETTLQGGFSNTFFQADTNNIGPRFGFAYRPFASGTTVVRGGFGIYYDQYPGVFGPGGDASNPPWGKATVNFSTALTGNPAAPFLPDLTFANPFPGGLRSGPNLHPTIVAIQRNYVNPDVKEWNFTLERQFDQNWMVRASYVGNQGHHLPFYAFDVNVPSVQQRNITLQNQRPYQPWASVNYNGTGGSAITHQLQASLQKRFSSGFLIDMEYSYTRDLDNVDNAGGPQDPNNLRVNYGNAQSTVRHLMVANYVYELPFGRGKPFWNHAGGAIEAIIGGWTISGITTYRSGTPFSVTFSVPSNYVGWLGGRADTVAGASLYTGLSHSHNVATGVPWFDPAAFAPPQPWTWGDASRNMLFGPGFENWDISLARELRIRERKRVQIRTDWLDAFNHFNPGNPSATIPDTRDGGPPNPNAGKIFGGSGNRSIQLGVRFEF
jgi:hypothetical protein